MIKKEDWKAWHEERKRFLKRDTEGFSKDLKAMKNHIIKLHEVCPKDTAGWPTGTALTLLHSLHIDYNRFESILESIRSENGTHQDANLDG